MINRKIIDIDLEKYITTSSQFNHPGAHKQVHNALNAAHWELGQIRQKLIQEKQISNLKYTLEQVNNLLRLNKYLAELDNYLVSIGRKIKNLPTPKPRFKSNEKYAFQGKQASISDAIRRLRKQISSIKTVLGDIKSDYQKQYNIKETMEMIEQIDEPLPNDTSVEQHRDIFNAGIVLVWGILVLWKRRKGKKK